MKRVVKENPDNADLIGEGMQDLKGSKGRKSDAGMDRRRTLSGTNEELLRRMDST